MLNCILSNFFLNSAEKDGVADLKVNLCVGEIKRHLDDFSVHVFLFLG